MKTNELPSSLTRPRTHVEMDLANVRNRAAALGNLANTIANEAGLGSIQPERTKLDGYMRELLLQSFSSPREHDRFASVATSHRPMGAVVVDGVNRTPPRDRVAEMRSELAQIVEFIEGLRERLELYPQANDPSKLEKVAEPGSAVNQTFHGPVTGVQVGSHNDQSVVVDALQSLVTQIEGGDGPDSEKAEAKSRLRAFLEHPLTVAALGAGVTAVLAGL
jgi:hypothetical protein